MSKVNDSKRSYDEEQKRIAVEEERKAEEERKSDGYGI